MRTKTTLAVRLVTRVTRVTRVDSPKTLICLVCDMAVAGGIRWFTGISWDAEICPRATLASGE